MDEAASRTDFNSAELEREKDQTLSTYSLNAFDGGSENSTTTLCSTTAFSEQLAFVEVNMVMLHSDQEPVLVQFSTTTQRRPIETQVTHDTRISHQPEQDV